MTTAAGGRNFVAWRDLTAQGQRANSTNQPLPAQSFARAVGNVNSQRRAVGRSVVLPPGLSQYGIDSPFSVAVQQVAPEGGFEQMLAASRAARGLPPVAPVEEDSGGGGRWLQNLGRDTLQTVRALPAGITELVGGLAADTGQYVADSAATLANAPGEIMRGDVGGTLQSIVPAVPGGPVAQGIIQHQTSPQDYQTSASVAQSFRRTANDAGALGSLATNLGEGREAAGNRLYDRFYNRPFSSFIEDVGNIAAVAAPAAAAVRAPTAAVARGGTAGAIARGIESGTARGGAAGVAARGVRGFGRAVDATNRAMAVPFTAPFRAARAGAMRIPRVSEFVQQGRMRNVIGRTVNSAVGRASQPTTASYRMAIREATRIAEEFGYDRAAVDGAVQLIRSGRLAGLGDNATIEAVLRADPEFFARDNPAAMLTEEGGIYNMPAESARLALEYYQNPTLHVAFEPMLNELDNHAMARDIQRVQGESAGYRKPMEVEELGGVRYDVDRINADPTVRAASRRQSALVSEQQALRADLPRLRSDVTSTARRVDPTNRSTFAEAVQNAAAAKRALGEAKARLAYLGDDVVAARGDLVAEINRAMQDYARIPERLKPAVETVERFRREAQATIDEGIAAGIPRSAFILHEAALAQLPNTIREVMQYLDYHGHRISEIDPGAPPGRRVSEVIGGTFNPEKPFARMIRSDPVSVRRPTRVERPEAMGVKPASLEIEALYEIENITQATFNVMMNEIMPGISRTPEQLFGSNRARQLGTDPTGQSAASAAKQGGTAPQTINFGGIDYAVPEGARWVVRNVDELFPESVRNTVDQGAIVSEQIFIPEFLERAMRGQIESMLNSARHAGTKLYDITNNVYRDSWLHLSPRWQIGNLAGNIFMQWAAGGQSIFQIMDNTRAASEFVRNFNETGLLPDTSMADLFNQGMTNAQADMFAGVFGNRNPGAVRRLIERSARLNSGFDAISRVSQMMSMMGDDFARIGEPGWRNQPVRNPATGEVGTLGQLYDNAMAETMRVVGDFTTFTPIERRLWRRIMPFYGWYRHVTRLMFSQPAANPMRTAWILHLGDLMFDPEDREAFPEWMQYSTVVDSGGDPWSIGGLVPVGDQFGDRGMFSHPLEFARSAQSPALNLVGAGVFGTRGIGGQPIRDQLGLPTGPLASPENLTQNPLRLPGYAAQLLGGPVRAVQGVVQPQSRTDYGTEREFRGEPQTPLRTPLGSLFQYAVGPAPYNPEVDFESIREQEERSREREAEERRRRQRGG
jgi:hypothetical protein